MIQPASYMLLCIHRYVHTYVYCYFDNRPKGNEVPSISNKLIAEEADELTTRYQTSPRQLPNVVSAADRGAVVNETHVDQSILGYAVVDIQDVRKLTTYVYQ